MQFCLSVYKCVCVSALHTFPTLKCQSGCHQANLSPRKAGKKTNVFSLRSSGFGWIPAVLPSPG